MKRKQHATYVGYVNPDNSGRGNWSRKVLHSYPDPEPIRLSWRDWWKFVIGIAITYALLIVGFAAGVAR